ncbi:MAG: hypothetical protein IJ693_02575 [Bacteroidaceae bacterium]|nr:hypothetical protein [Bacteroidaceae bacterium]
MEERMLEHIDYNLNYLTQMFKKVKFKPIESYIAQRIWHRLDRTNVEMVCQQYVRRGEAYALVDLFFPQINYGVEIDEAYHANPEQKRRDELRTYEIIRNTEIKLERIICYDKNKSTENETFYCALEDIHQQVDKVVSEIRQRIEEEEKQSRFQPWTNEDKLKPDFHRAKGVLRVKDNDSFRTTLDICKTFGMDVKSNRRGGKSLNNGYLLWWPKYGHKTWSNELSEDGETITERKNTAPTVSTPEPLLEQRKRITFFKQENAFGVSLYRFVGVFQMSSTDKDVTTYVKVADEYSLAKQK